MSAAATSASDNDSAVTSSGASVAPASLPAFTAMFSMPNTRPRRSMRLRRCMSVIDRTSNTTTPTPTATSTAHATAGSSMTARSASGIDDSSSDAITVNAGRRTVATRPTTGTTASAPTPMAALSTPTPSDPSPSVFCATNTRSTSSKPRADAEREHQPRHQREAGLVGDGVDARPERSPPALPRTTRVVDRRRRATQEADP